MAAPAVGRETIAFLRQHIAKIEGRLAERLDGNLHGEPHGDIHLRRHDGLPKGSLLATGVAGFDAALGGGLPGAGLTEIHAAGTRDSGAAAAFILGLSRVLIEQASAPLLWVGLSESFREAGYPYPPGMQFLQGIEPSRLLVAQAEKLADALWIAEQAAALDGFSAIVLETRGPSARLDLRATLRLHRRALDAGHPLFLLRQMGFAQPTAAPFRLIVQSASAGMRNISGKPLARSIGPPAFLVEISKNRTAPSTRFTLEWNTHARAFNERAAEDHVAVVSASQHGASAAPAAGTLLAFAAPAGTSAAGRQPAGEQHPAHRRLG